TLTSLVLQEASELHVRVETCGQHADRETNQNEDGRCTGAGIDEPTEQHAAGDQPRNRRADADELPRARRPLRHDMPTGGLQTPGDHSWAALLRRSTTAGVPFVPGTIGTLPHGR